MLNMKVKSIVLATFILSLAWKTECNNLGPRCHITRTPDRLKRQTQGQSDSKKCIAPAQPDHGAWTYLSDDRRGDANELVDAKTAITFSCKPDYKLSTTNEASLTAVCLGTGYWSVTALPICQIRSMMCMAPAQPNHGEWTYPSNGRKGDANVLVDANTVINFSCNSGYKLSNTIEASLPIICLGTGNWSVTVLPICQKLCKGLYNSPLLTLSCKNDGSLVPCDRATDNTILTYKCAPYYEPPHGLRKATTCYDGSWDYTPSCIPVCGEKRVSATPLIVNGVEVERGDYPWVVALYSSINSDPFYTNICSGSLISTQIVITAAHCVTRQENGKVHSVSYYRVGAGKYFNSYEDMRDNDTAQYAEVTEIKTHREYHGEMQNYRGDIALLKLKTNLALSKVVQPVCYNNLPPLEPNTVGLVTGWGYTTSSGEPSETLKVLELPYNEDEECLKDLDPDFASRYFGSDKLCAGFTNHNTSTCKGDGGGGLVFKNSYYKRRYFIHGVLSLAHSYVSKQQVHCNIQRSALFTKVETYIDWIQLTVRQWTIHEVEIF